MLKVNFLYKLFLILIIFLIPDVAHADVFGTLAGYAKNIGGGLRSAGYIIAGLGLIAFSVAAIFNKISWKTLAYIMMSCFVLTSMFAVVNYMAGKNVVTDPKFNSSNSANTEQSGDTKSVPVKK